ncbi:MAG: trypsin-like peptidase domain-containing protein [Parcubacteria group bacterium]|nr:trypsin-like peptidase domain-containing protein [Parcubacteria group bacterium]
MRQLWWAIALLFIAAILVVALRPTLTSTGGRTPVGDPSVDSQEEGTDARVAARLRKETQLKRMALKAPYIVSLEVGDTTVGVTVLTGFIVDSRGYLRTAAHGDFHHGGTSQRIRVFLANGRKFRGRFAGEIQTLDVALVALDQSFNFAVAKFADLSQIVKRGEYYVGEELSVEKRMVVVRCVDQEGVKLRRVLVGEIRQWKDSEVTFLQLQQDTKGCSGGPVLALSGGVVAMVRSSAGDLVYGIDAPSLESTAKLLIKSDQSSRQK